MTVYLLWITHSFYCIGGGSKHGMCAIDWLQFIKQKLHFFVFPFSFFVGVYCVYLSGLANPNLLVEQKKTIAHNFYYLSMPKKSELDTHANQIQKGLDIDRG